MAAQGGFSLSELRGTLAVPNGKLLLPDFLLRHKVSRAVILVRFWLCLLELDGLGLRQ